MTAVQHTLGDLLPPASDPPPCRPVSAASDEAQPSRPLPQTRLWLCLSLPWLALEVHAGYDPDEPTVLTAVQGQQVRVEAVSPAAAAAGIAVGMTRSAAQALCQDLRLEAREPLAESRRLEWLARRVSRWSSWVSVMRPDKLLLEIAGSRRLFGDVRDIRDHVMADLSHQGHAARTAIASTARAATWLSATPGHRIVTDHDATRQAIATLPLAVLDLSARQHERLHRTGLRNLGHLLRLPRDGLARRHGPALLQQLDEALGRAPETLPVFAPAESFSADLDLPAPESAVPRLMTACQRLISDLVRYLRAHDAAVDRLRITLLHEHAPASRLTVGLSSAGRDSQRLLDVLGEHLDRLTLPEPVLALRLQAPRILPAAAGTRDWLDNTLDSQWSATLDRWRARLGTDAVRAVSACADHRPEHAWTAHAYGRHAPCPPPPAAERPTWLLNTPQPLPVHDHTPVHDGQLTIETGPERIEQGWWDSHGAGHGDISRDYYVMRTPDGRRLWVFQDRQRLGWWLHGFFA